MSPDPLVLHLKKQSKQALADIHLLLMHNKNTTDIRFYNDLTLALDNFTAALDTAEKAHLERQIERQNKYGVITK